MNHSILLVEDSPEFHALVKGALKDLADVTAVATVAEALQLINLSQFDLMLIDIGLPDKSGFELCSELRASEKTQHIPIFFMTGRAEVSDKVAGFSLGADDYIVKPFNVLEFRARVSARLKKNENDKQRVNILKQDGVEMNLFSHEVIVRNNNGNESVKVELTPHEYNILKTLIAKPNQVFSRAKLLDSVWGSTTFVDDRTVDKHISSLRKKLGAKGSCIHTISGVGYKFEVANRMPPPVSNMGQAASIHAQ